MIPLYYWGPIALLVLLVFVLTLKIRHIRAIDRDDADDVPRDLVDDILGSSYKQGDVSYVAVKFVDVRGRTKTISLDPRQALEFSHHLLGWGARGLPQKNEP